MLSLPCRQNVIPDISDCAQSWRPPWDRPRPRPKGRHNIKLQLLRKLHIKDATTWLPPLSGLAIYIGTLSVVITFKK